MAVKLEEVLAEFDIPTDKLDELTLDEVKKIRDEKFIGRATVDQDAEIVNRITGKRIGFIETDMKRGFKELGVEIDPAEAKDKKVEELYQLGVNKLKGQMEALRLKSAEGNDKKLNDLQKQFDDQAKSLKEKEELLGNANNLLTQKEQEFNGQMKTFKIGHKLNEAKSKVPFADTVNELTRKGFEFEFGQNYQVDIDDQENLVVMDKAGNKIKNATGTGFLSFDDVYKAEAAKNQLLKLNNAKTPAGGNGGGGNGGTGGGNGGQQQQNTNWLNPKAKANAEKLRAAQG